MAPMATRTKNLLKFLTSLTNRTSQFTPGSSSNHGVALLSSRVDPAARFVSCTAYSTATTEVRSNEPEFGVGVGSKRVGLDILGVVKDYADYRRSLYGDITHKALLVDAVGTLVVPSQPMAQIYREIGEKYGVEYSENEILNRYRRAYEKPWGRSRLRYVNDGRPFWQYIVSSSTGCSCSCVGSPPLATLSLSSEMHLLTRLLAPTFSTFRTN